MATSLNSTSRPTRISLRDILVVTAGIALILTVLSFRADLAAIAFFATLSVSCFVAVISFRFRSQRLIRLTFRYASLVFALSVVVLLSLGPACWMMTSPAFARLRHPAIKTAFLHFYRPVGINYSYSPEPVHGMAFGYLRWWASDNASIGDHGWGVRITIDGNMTVIGI